MPMRYLYSLHSALEVNKIVIAFATEYIMETLGLLFHVLAQVSLESCTEYMAFQGEVCTELTRAEPGT
jgi:hypothetical protein